MLKLLQETFRLKKIKINRFLDLDLTKIISLFFCFAYYNETSKNRTYNKYHIDPKLIQNKIF